MKIGIIGSSGFVGSNLYLHLSKTTKNKIFKLSSHNKYKKKWINTVCKEIKNKKPDILINCASSQDLGEDNNAIKDLINSNLYAGSAFLNQATQNNNFSGYISFGTKWEFDQNGKYNPLNFYAATKHVNDYFLKYFSIKKNITTVSLKIFDTYGVNDKRKKILNLLLDSYKKNKVLKISPGKQYLDFVNVLEICELIKRICTDIRGRKIKGFNRYTVSSKKPIKLINLINILRKKLNKRLKVKIGAKKYRKNEAMKPLKTIYNYPGWKSKKNLILELKKIFDN